MSETESFGAVVCSAAVLDDGTLLLYPQDEALRERLKTLREGTSIAQWEQPMSGPSGAAYHPLLVIFEGEGSSVAAAFVPPSETRPYIESGRMTKAVVVLSEAIEDPLDAEMLLASGIPFDVPPMPFSLN